MNLAHSLWLTGAEIGLTVAGIALLLAAGWTGRRSARGVTIGAVAALVGAIVWTAMLARGPALNDVVDAFDGLYRVDGFGSFAKILIYAATALCLVVTPRYFAGSDAYRGEYPVLLLFNAVGMGMMVSAADLLTLYIGLELSSLSSYVLASFARNDSRSAEAGLKYFVLGALASGILLYGMSLVYGFAGTTSYDGIRIAFADDFRLGALVGLVFVLAGLAFKIAAVPFHMWTPDVYEGSPTPVTVFFATATKIAAVAMLLRVVLYAFPAQVDAWRQIMMFTALASIVVGALGAIGQNSLKRLLAYSSINNIGFILIGLALGTAAGASAVLTYLVIYAAMTLAGFTALLMLRDVDGRPFETFDDIAGLARRQPAIAYCLALTMFALAGIPPLFGFWAKFVVFAAAVEAGFVALAAIGIAASVIGAFYYIKFVKVMLFDPLPEGDGARVLARAPAGHWAVLVAATLLISPLGFFATPWLSQSSDNAASALFARS